MSEQFLLWTEIIFDLLYLATIWLLVVLMYRNRERLLPQNKKIGGLFIVAFFLLALGDAGHVGFRVLAYAMGGLDANPVLIGAGALATAVTVTFFYMAMIEIWRIRFDKKRGLLWWTLILAGLIRLGIMIPVANQWGSVVPPFDWSIARNIPLVIQGLGVAIALLVSGIKSRDKFAKSASFMIFVSYLCYAPVILFVQKIPQLGMLMMPKTLAYVAVAVLVYVTLFGKEKVSSTD